MGKAVWIEKLEDFQKLFKEENRMETAACLPPDAKLVDVCTFHPNKDVYPYCEKPVVILTFESTVFDAKFTEMVTHRYRGMPILGKSWAVIREKESTEDCDEPEPEPEAPDKAKYEIGDMVWFYNRQGKLLKSKITYVYIIGQAFRVDGEFRYADSLSPTREECEKAGTPQKRKMDSCMCEATQIITGHDKGVIERDDMIFVVQLAIAMYNDM